MISLKMHAAATAALLIASLIPGIASTKDREKHFGKIVPTVAPDPMPEEVGRMMKRHRVQLTELLTNYG